MGREGGPWRGAGRGVEDKGLWVLTLPIGPSVAVDRLPDFLAAPNDARGQPLPHHQCSIHLNCEHTTLLHQAFEDAMDGWPSHRWVGPGLRVRWGILMCECGPGEAGGTVQTQQGWPLTPG